MVGRRESTDCRIWSSICDSCSALQDRDIA
jgi:hypothetical protein